MDIAFVTAEYPPKNIGGAGISSKLIVDSLREKDVNVDVYALIGEQNNLNQRSTNFYELPSGEDHFTPIEIAKNISVINNLPNLDDYDVVHCYNTGHLPATVVRARPPVLATINNHMWVCIDPMKFLKEGRPKMNFKKMYRYASSSGYTGVEGFGRCALEYIGKQLSKKSDRITVQTEGMKQVLGQCGYDTNKISVVPNLVDPDFLVPNHEPAHTKKRTLVFLGRLVEKKGPLDAAKAFCELPADIHNQWRFHIYGKGPQEDQIKNVIKNSSNSVEIELKYASYDNLPSVYQEADVLIHPSKYTEPFSRTWLEALATETFIICSKNLSSEAILSDVASLYDPFNKNEPAKTLSETLQKDDFGDQLSRGKNVARQYTPQKIVGKYIDLYRDLI